MYFSETLKHKEQTALEKNQKILAMISGIASGPEDGSENYKEYVTEYLDKKYPDE